MGKWLCVLLLPACWSLAPAFGGDIHLSGGEAAAIRAELALMSEATARLRGELNASRETSRALLETSAALQTRLESAVKKLEESGTLLEQSEAELAALLTDLGSLRAGYAALTESYGKQKNAARRWKLLAAAGWISAGIIGGGAIIWGAVR